MTQPKEMHNTNKYNKEYKYTDHRNHPSSRKFAQVDILNKNLEKLMDKYLIPMHKARKMVGVPGFFRYVTTKQLSGYNGQVVVLLRGLYDHR